MGPRDPQIVLITGATTGIGLALVRTLYAAGYHVIATARPSSLRRFEEIGLVADDRLEFRALDVSSRESIEQCTAALVADYDGVDVIINNAGVAYRAVVEHTHPDDEHEIFDVNCLGPLHVIRGLLEPMRRRRCGHIVNISSVGGMMAMPTMSTYSSSKFALEGASESLWYEMRPWNIRVNLIQPGFVHSHSFRNTRHSESGRASEADPRDPYHVYYHAMEPFIVRMMGLARATPESIALLILKRLQRRTLALRIPATLDAWFFSYLRRLVPRRLYHRILYRGLPGIRRWGPKHE